MTPLCPSCAALAGAPAELRKAAEDVDEAGAIVVARFVALGQALRDLGEVIGMRGDRDMPATIRRFARQLRQLEAEHVSPAPSSHYACPPPARRTAAPCSDRRTIRVPVADAAVRDALLETLTDARVLRAAVDSAGEDAPQVDPRASTVELERLAGQEARLLRLLDEGLLSEAVARERLGQIRTARGAAETARQAAVAAQADAGGGVSGQDAEEAASRLGQAIRRASPARWREVVRIIIPAREPFGAWLRRGQIEIVGRLPLEAAALAGHLGTSSARSVAMPGVRFRLRVAA